MIKKLFFKSLSYVKKNKVTTIILVISIVCLIISLAVNCHIPGKLKLVSQDVVYGDNVAYFEFVYKGSKPISSSLLVACCNNAYCYTGFTYYDNATIKRGDTITVKVNNWDGKLKTVYLYYGDRILAKS